MKNVRWTFLVVIVLALCSAFANSKHVSLLSSNSKKETNKLGKKKYRVLVIVVVNGQIRIYIIEITGQAAGIDYLCQASSDTCTIEVDESITPHHDANGDYFLESEVETSTSGTYQEL